MLVDVVRREQPDEFTKFLDSNAGRAIFGGGDVQRFTFTLATTYAGALVQYAVEKLPGSPQSHVDAIRQQALDTASAAGIALHPNAEGVILQCFGGPRIYKPKSILEWDPLVFWTMIAVAAACSKLGRCTPTETMDAYDKAVDYLEHHGRPLPLRSR